MMQDKIINVGQSCNSPSVFSEDVLRHGTGEIDWPEVFIWRLVKFK